mgnify:CR=1 FL=1
MTKMTLSPFTETITADGSNNLVSSNPTGGGDGPASMPNLFSDGFEGGDIQENAIAAVALNTIDFIWESKNKTSVVTGPPFSNEVVLDGGNNVVNDARDWTAKEGLNSMRFRFPDDSFITEQRFNHDTNTDQWIRFWLRVPANYTHATGGGGSTNNKFFALYNGANPNTNATVNVRLQLRDNGAGGSNITLQDGYSAPETLSSPFISVPADRGRYMQVVIHTKTASASGVDDGIIQLYRRWENESTFTAVINLTAAEEQWGGAGIGFNHGYILGANNGLYAVDTEFLLDTFEMSSGSLIT